MASIDYLLIKKDALECPICLRSPVDSFSVFPCGHSVCHSCTVMVSSQLHLKSTWTGKQFYECPICRRRVAPKEIQRPPLNFFVQSLLDTAVPFSNSDQVSPRKQKFSDEKLAKKEKMQLVEQTSIQRQRLELLEGVHAELQKRTTKLYYVTYIAFILAIIFLVVTVYLARRTWANERQLCWSLVDRKFGFIEIRSFWQRFSDYLLLRQTDNPTDKPIIDVLRLFHFLLYPYLIYCYWFRH